MKKPKNRTEIGGVLGEKVTLQKVNNRVVVTNRPQRVIKPATEKQEAVQQRFLEAVQYSKQQMENVDSRELYEAAVPEKGKSARQLAMIDYLTIPKVREIDTSTYQGNVGDMILIRATDDFMVVSVNVTVKDKSGKVIETGEAEPEGKINKWKYAATVSNPSLKGTSIQVIAYDHPGNRGIREVAL